MFSWEVKTRWGSMKQHMVLSQLPWEKQEFATGDTLSCIHESVSKLHTPLNEYLWITLQVVPQHGEWTYDSEIKSLMLYCLARLASTSWYSCLHLLLQMLLECTTTIIDDGHQRKLHMKFIYLRQMGDKKMLMSQMLSICFSNGTSRIQKKGLPSSSR